MDEDERVTVPLRELLIAAILIVGDRGHGTWDHRLPSVMKIYYDNPEKVDEIESEFRL
jgi:hypothetical protein